MANYVVTLKPNTSTATDLDDKGFIGGSDAIEFTVLSDTPGLTATQVRQELQDQNKIPLEGYVHPDSGLSIVRSIPIRQISPIYYEGTLNYRATPRPSDEQDEDQDPWDMPASFKFSSVTTQVSIDSDINGNAIVNPGTNEPVEGITRPVTDFLITITKNLQSINPVGVQAFANKVSSDTFLGFAAGLCKTGDITADPSVHQGTTYYTVVVPVMVREIYGGVTAAKAWWHRRVLKGYYHLKAPSDTKPVRAVDDEGQPTSSPVLLKADGTRLPSGDPPVFKEVQRHNTAAFSGFGIL